jgi:hypothetical protein
MKDSLWTYRSLRHFASIDCLLRSVLEITVVLPTLRPYHTSTLVMPVTLGLLLTSSALYLL